MATGEQNSRFSGSWFDFAAVFAYLGAMVTFAPLVRFRVYSGSLLTRFLPRAEAVAC